jgi:hypothetical protein
MRRALALLFVVALFVRSAPALAAPLDLDLSQLGNPSDADARQRFALLSSEMALALSSLLLEPASTTGLSGFAIDLDLGYAPVHPTSIGGQTSWPTRVAAPSALWLPSLHVRKGLPYSFEIGGRAIYVLRSTMVAGQGEVKWALNEGFWNLPDLAVRAAYTHLFGQSDWNLSTVELDVILGKSFALGGTLKLAPYGALRLTWLDASTGPMNGNPPFPTIAMHDHLFPRWTLGVRLATGALSLGAEATYFAGKTFEGPSSLGASDYPTFEVASSWSAAAKLGLEF